MENLPVFPSCYLGTIQYFAHLVQYSGTVAIEVHSPYQRKSYRNRCLIMGANGKMPLSIPVTNHKNEKTLLKDTLVSYDTPWQKQHWRSIVSAYNSSPFFEYYKDAIEASYQNTFEHLIDLNLDLTQVILEEIGADIELIQTIEKSENTQYRYLVNPKIPLAKDTQFKVIPYRQVFAEKHAFEGNLSILDLLFNKGPETLSWLEDSLNKCADV